jgi:hypothetical protein
LFEVTNYLTTWSNKQWSRLPDLFKVNNFLLFIYPFSTHHSQWYEELCRMGKKNCEHCETQFLQDKTYILWEMWNLVSTDCLGG